MDADEVAGGGAIAVDDRALALADTVDELRDDPAVRVRRVLAGAIPGLNA